MNPIAMKLVIRFTTEARRTRSRSFPLCALGVSVVNSNRPALFRTANDILVGHAGNLSGTQVSSMFVTRMGSVIK